MDFYVVIASVSRSGMTRKMRFYDEAMSGITHEIAGKTGYRMDKDGNLIVHGCGMDMPWYVLYRYTRNNRVRYHLL